MLLTGLKIKTNKKFILICLFCAVLIFIPAYFTHAQSGDPVEMAGGGAIAAMLETVKYVVGKLVDLTANMLDEALRMSAYNLEGNNAVRISWGIVRNFANMFFIVALIIMAFATIFDITKYNFGALVARFIIAALLINFSLVICGFILSTSQIFANVLLNAIGSVSDKVAQGLDISTLLTWGPPGYALTYILSAINIARYGATEVIGSLVVSIIMLSIVAISFTVASIFTIIRVPIVWILAIVSPLAWILGIFPTTQQYYKKWWDEFLSWTFFLPIYLFVIYLGTYFLSQRSVLLTALQANPNQPMASLFFYILAAVFMIGGAKYAIGFASMGSSHVMKTASWLQGKAASPFFFAGRTLRNAPSNIYSATGVKGGVEAKRQEISQRGAAAFGFGSDTFLGKMWGGTEGRKSNEAKIAAMLGVKGADAKLQKEFLNKSTTEYGLIEDDFKQNKTDMAKIKLMAFSGKANDPKVFAARRFLQENVQDIDSNDPTASARLVRSTLEELSNNPFAAEGYIKSIASNMKADDLKNLATGEGDFAGISGTAALLARKQVIEELKKNKKIAATLTSAQLPKIMNVIGGVETVTGRELLEAVEEANPAAGIDYKMNDSSLRRKIEDRPDFKTPTFLALPARSKDYLMRFRLFQEQLKGASEIAKMHISTWQRLDFRGGLRNKILSFRRSKARNDFVFSLASEVSSTANGDEKLAILKDILKYPGINITIT
jgi:hypothetical protein